jgi:hypothetical protein
MRTYAGLLGSTAPDLGDGMSVTTMLVIALVGLLVVIFGGLALAVIMGLFVGRRRRATDDDAASDESDSTGTPFK